MLVGQIEMSQIRFGAEEGCCEADMQLLLLDAEGPSCGQAMLTCSAHRVLDGPSDNLTERLVNEARRQMSWMPEHRMGGSSLAFSTMEPQPLIS